MSVAFKNIFLLVYPRHICEHVMIGLCRKHALQLREVSAIARPNMFSIARLAVGEVKLITANMIQLGKYDRGPVSHANPTCM